MPTKKFLAALSALFAASLLLAACDEAEQGRTLRYEKGTYLGQKDRPLSEAERAELRLQIRRQKGI